MPSCYYCGKPTNDLAANPSEWSIPLCHPDEPGVVKFHHAGCIYERIEAYEKLLTTNAANQENAETFANQRDEANTKNVELTAKVHRLTEICDNAEKAIQACAALKEWGASTPEYLASRVAYLCNLYADSVYTIGRLDDDRKRLTKENAALREEQS